MKEQKQLWAIVGIITITGLLGGLGNLLFNLEKSTTLADISSISISKSLVLGLIGAGIVPLLPGILAGNIIDYGDTKPGIIYTRMIKFASFCLLASLFSTSVLADALEIVKGSYKEVQDKLVEQDQRIAQAEEKSESAEEKSKDANAKSDIALKIEKISVGLIQDNHEEDIKAKENLVSKLVSDNNLTTREQELYRKAQKSVYLKLEEVFSANPSDSVEITKSIQNLRNKELVYETTIDGDKVIISKAQWFGN